MKLFDVTSGSLNDFGSEIEAVTGCVCFIECLDRCNTFCGDDAALYSTWSARENSSVHAINDLY